ncbi:hypothetical protein ACFU5Y_31915 [Streptomyces gardneri]|uniref:hypothetical protein n=1 Tax=Streptomyces gardneri TaxID=66892 RepID=UPI0036CA4B7C
MAHVVFDQAEQRELREAARDEFPESLALTYVLEDLASEGIDVNGCRDGDDIRAEKGLPELSGEAFEVA